jgi:diguanylate cyclase (GGDEF)-like protein
MTWIASTPPQGPDSGPRSTLTSSTGLAEALARFQKEIDAVAVGISIGDGALAKHICRSESAGRLLAQVWEHGSAGLMEQARNSKGPIGTNKLRGVADGPVCGKLIATALRDPSGTMTGFIIALRTVEQDKFTARESQRLTELAAEIAGLMNRKTAPEPPAGLMSWNVFEERATAQERTAAASGCVLYGNVDQLHVLNKLAGFTAGDRAIAAVGEALHKERNLPEGAGACHLSGDRFTVYLPATALPQARKIAEQLSRAVSERCSKLDGLRTKLSISFGVAAIPVSESGVSQALAMAEAACRAAKDRGRGRVEVYQDTDQSIVRRNDDVVIVGKLRKALETQRFSVVAQPLYRLQDAKEPDCYELLLRLLDDSGEMISPAPFISAAMRYGLLTEIDQVVIARVLDRLKAARGQLEGRGLRFSMNLSGPSIGDPAFLEWLMSGIGPAGVPGEWLQFELTEAAAVANVAQAQTMIRQLRARGVEFALDDFGTGVSSFAYLKAFDVSMLKLDGSLTRDLMSNPRSESLVKGIAQLGRGMGIQTAAECVESQEVRDRLALLGIDRAQGFYFGQPLLLEAVLAERATPPSTLTPALTDKLLTETSTPPTQRAPAETNELSSTQAPHAADASEPRFEFEPDAPAASHTPLEADLPDASQAQSESDTPTIPAISETMAQAYSDLENDLAVAIEVATRLAETITGLNAEAELANTPEPRKPPVSAAG